MAQLRVFESNGGKFIDLLAYKKEKRQLEAKEESISAYESAVKSKRKAYEYGYQGSINDNIISKRKFFGRLINDIIAM